MSDAELLAEVARLEGRVRRESLHSPLARGMLPGTRRLRRAVARGDALHRERLLGLLSAWNDEGNPRALGRQLRRALAVAGV